MRTRYVTLAFAAAIAALAAQFWTTTEGATFSASTMTIMEMQIQAGKNLPATETGDLV
jgi:hypothetical protein